MAKTKEATTDNGYVPVFLFKDNDRYKDPALNVIINGVKYSVPRGKEVMVPREVALVIERSQAGDRLAQQIDLEAQKEKAISM